MGKEPLARQRLSHSLRIATSVLGLLLVVFLAGCVRFHPQPLSPEETAAQFESRSITNSAFKTFLEQNLHRALEPWPVQSWDFEELTMAAFYYHPSLELARANWNLASAGTKTAAERPNPTVTANTAYEPAADAFSPWIPGLIFDLPIETAGKRRLRMQEAQHLSESAKFSLATAAWQVRSRVRATLLDFVAARRRESLLEEQVALRSDYAARLQSQLQAGAISSAEVNLARLALVRSRADLADTQRLLAETLPRLADALGLPSSALRGEHFDFKFADVKSAESMTTSEMRRLALLGRADILGALADYASTQSALQLEIAKQYPDIHLAPGYSWNAGSAGEHDWQLGATVELPVLNRHRGPIDEAAARRNASAARFLALQSKTINEIDGAIASFRASQTNLTTLENLESVQKNQRQNVRAQFQAGALDRLDVLAADLELNAVNLVLLDAQVKLQQAIGALEDAVQRPFELPKAVFESNQADARAISRQKP